MGIGSSIGGSIGSALGKSLGEPSFGGAAAWTPLSLGASLLAWYDGSDSSSITESAGAVSQWDDKSGNGNHATQATGAHQPTVETDGGGYQRLTFDGTDDGLEFGPLSSVEYVAVALVLPAGLIAADTIFARSHLNDTNSIRLKGATSYRAPGNSADAGDFQNGDGNNFINGVDTDTFTPTETHILEALAGSTTEKELGTIMYPAYSGREGTGSVYGVIIASSVPSASDREQARSYLASISGVTL